MREADAAEALGSQASAKRSQPYYLDVTHPDANKGAVVHALTKHLEPIVLMEFVVLSPGEDL